MNHFSLDSSYFLCKKKNDFFPADSDVSQLIVYLIARQYLHVNLRLSISIIKVYRDY
jgi:hypothetical protein